MATQIVGAIGLAAALVAVYYAWRTANLARLERREARLRTLVEAVLEVRRAADEVFVAYDLGRSRAETTAVVFAFHQAQDRLRLAVESGHLPAALVEDELVLERLRALLDRRPLNVVKAAGPLLGDPRLLRPPRAGAASLKRRLRITQPCLLPDVEPARRPSGGCAVQTATSTSRWLQMVVPAPHRGLVRLRRRIEDPGGAWEVSPPFAASLGSVDAVSLCVGNRGSPESLEILARTGGALRHLSLPATVEIGAEDDSTRAELGIDDAAGVPAIVQGAFGNRGNLEVVTPTLGGGLAHLWRDNDHRDGPWERTADFGEGQFESVALIHGDLHDHLELIARVGPRLVHWWRTNADSSRWREAEMRRAEGEGQCPPVTGVPGFLHSRRSGSRGNFEVVAPLADGGLLHMWRDNDHESHCWRRAAIHQSPLLDASVVVEGDRRDGARDLLIFAHGSGLTLTRRQAQPGVDRATGPGTAIPEGVTWRALLPDLERQTVEAPPPDPADIAGSRSVNSAPPPGAAEAVTVPP